MSVLERAMRNEDVQSTTSQHMQRLRVQLKEGLVKHLGYRELASIAGSDDVQKARAELSIALFSVMNEGGFESLGAAERERLARETCDDIVGLGPLETFMDDETVSEVVVNGTLSLYFERAGKMHRAERVFDSDEQIRAAIERIIAPLGRRLDEQSPMVDARLKNGFRVNAVIPPVAVDGPLLTIRKFMSSIVTLDEMVGLGSLPAWYAALLGAAVRTRQDIAVVGGTGSGKTTLLNALSRQIDPCERIVTIEDSAELKFAPDAHVARLEARRASIEGTGEVTIRMLVINALRMRPDRIVVGEVRGGEAVDMLQAMNTGHDGSLTTLHAGSAREAVLRLVMMARFGIDLPADILEGQVATALDLIVMTHRLPGGARRVGGLTCVQMSDEGRVSLRECVHYDDVANTWQVVEEPPFVAEGLRVGVLGEEEVVQWRTC
jgi:pilus assembly protein CpaF